ncbi:TniQ family protein [Nonomuraea sp. NEAU-A123]|uniref:TniQ family protein n=1 Tax=Nonomuraea sp. NEAU-A123 TaxID=2839649 RepID=UPI001BE472AE|nr:TniQ family protein [Nonomuraea sp. NEAU-A123]MBT2226333.1 TniQ family protein [Nonomuraea sp. NEAU-A123]
MTVMRTLPIRMTPLPGESLDFWLEAYAHRTQIRYGDVLSSLGLLTKAKSRDLRHPRPTDWTIALSEREADNIAFATGLDKQRVHAMTLAHFHGRALLIDHEKRQVNRHRLWGRGTGSRYCPDCLADNAGRWRLEWRLGWSFACTRHSLLLADTCQGCRRLTRARPFSRHSLPIPGRCGGRPARSADLTAPRGCDQDLTQAEVVRLAAGHPVVEAQDLIMNMIETGHADFGQYSRHPQPSTVALSELRAVASRMLIHLNADDLAARVPADILGIYLTPRPSNEPERRAAAMGRPGAMAPPTAVMTAVAVITAMQVLGEEHLDTAAHALRTVIGKTRDGSEKTTTTTIRSWGRGTGTVLQTVQLAALGPLLRPSDQLRFQTVALPSSPSATARQIGRRSRKLPATLWPSWAVRLSPSSGAYQRILAPVLAAAALLVGTKLELDEAASMLGSISVGNSLSRVLQMLHDRQCWEPVAAALVHLVHYLDENDIPIDYQRRRTLDYSNLLPAEQWVEICRQSGQSPGIGRRARIARCVLFNQISGMPLDRAPDFPTTDVNSFRAEAERFTEVWTPQLANALRQVARDFVSGCGLRSEPVAWCPPLGILDGLDLPGTDPSTINIDRLHELTRGRRYPAGSAAQTLGVSIEAVRLLLEEHPIPAPPLSTAQARALGQVSHAARQVLTEEELRRRYLDEHQSARTIAIDVGVSKSTVTRLAAEYGIELRKVGRYFKQHNVIDRDWLYEQYITRRRTLADIAREKGTSTTYIIHRAQDLGVPLRASGGASTRKAMDSKADFNRCLGLPNEPAGQLSDGR